MVSRGHGSAEAVAEFLAKGEKTQLLVLIETGCVTKLKSNLAGVGCVESRVAFGPEAFLRSKSKMGVEEAVPPNRKGKVLPRNRTQSANFTKEMTFFS